MGDRAPGAAPKGASRQAFRCTGCGLRVEGTVTARGRVVACDRAPSAAGRAVIPFRCGRCLEHVPHAVDCGCAECWREFREHWGGVAEVTEATLREAFEASLRAARKG